jgi:hypothetical protein
MELRHILLNEKLNTTTNANPYYKHQTITTS